MTAQDKKAVVVTSSFQPAGEWMGATAPEAVVHPAWRSLMDATSKLPMIGLQKALGNVECSSMVYQWAQEGARVRPVSGAIKIEQEVGMSNSLPAGSSIAYSGKDGSSMQVEAEFVMGFPEFCPTN